MRAPARDERVLGGSDEEWVTAVMTASVSCSDGPDGLRASCFDPTGRA